MPTVPPASSFHWPEGKHCAVSLSFDDGRVTQVDHGLSILDSNCVNATFYLTPPLMEQRLEQWRFVARSGHEIGNHTVTHPCTGNLEFTRTNAIEDYTLERMDAELAQANAIIEDKLGVTPRTFAYPCGGTFLGRGETAASYIPLVARRFLAGRGYWEPYPNSPGVCDLAHLLGCSFDALPFNQVKALIDRTIDERGWLILVGHDIRTGDWQGVDPAVLTEICQYLNCKTDIWVDTIASVAEYVRGVRSTLGHVRKQVT
ncbi:MAG: polysaccharide deacetylase family protein [Candidatus Hydrogenedentes bacterium]|nr:polysaccharide deacetylase family protein [Candidatus Hydrogenedentota bacterium]